MTDDPLEFLIIAIGKAMLRGRFGPKGRRTRFQQYLPGEKDLLCFVSNIRIRYAREEFPCATVHFDREVCFVENWEVGPCEDWERVAIGGDDGCRLFEPCDPHVFDKLERFFKDLEIPFQWPA